MKTEECIERLRDYYESTLVNGRKNATEKARAYIGRTLQLYSRMTDLHGVEIDGLSDEIWLGALRRYMRTDRAHKTQWQMFGWPTYKMLRVAIVFARDQYTCQNQRCGLNVAELDIEARRIGVPSGGPFGFAVLCVDHRVARAIGGGEELSNLQCLCRTCNMAKGPFGDDALARFA
jgi:hypothetical protein